VDFDFAEAADFDFAEAAERPDFADLLTAAEELPDERRARPAEADDDELFEERATLFNLVRHATRCRPLRIFSLTSGCLS